LGNEVLLNAAYLFISFILLKICNILTGCYRLKLQNKNEKKNTTCGRRWHNCYSHRRRHNADNRRRRLARRQICDGGSQDLTKNMRFHTPKVVFVHQEEDESVYEFRDIQPTLCLGSIKSRGISTSISSASGPNTRGHRVQQKKEKK